MDKLPLNILVVITLAIPLPFLQAVNSDPPYLEDPEQQVIGGVDAAIRDYPFMGALVFNVDGDNSGQFCGCTAIDPYWVLTAAHCLDDGRELGEFKIIFGTADLSNFEAGLAFYPKTMISHPNYSDLYDDKYSDLALVQLSTPLPDWITPIQLNDSEALELPGTKAIIAGWGRIDFDSGDTDLLQSAEVTLFDLETSTLSDLSKSRVQGTLIPAGEIDPYTSTYSGDSGGPLMIFENESNSWIQVGITSYGSGNKAENPISFYTRVSSFKAWVDQIVQNDFHHWLGQNKVQNLFKQDGDPHSPLSEWMLGLDPNEKDAPELSMRLERNTSTHEQTIFLPLKIRESIPKDFLKLVQSTDVKTWHEATFPYDNWSKETVPGSELPLYHIPLVTEDRLSTFYRLEIQNSSGITHGPIPLALGNFVNGHLGNAYGGYGITPDGPTRYDFTLGYFSNEYPIDIFVQLYGDAQYRLEIYDLEQRKVIEEFLYGRNKYFSKSDFSPEEDVNYLVRIEFVEGSGYVPFSIYTDYSPHSFIKTYP